MVGHVEHGVGGRHRLLGVPARHHAEVSHHPAPQPVLVDAVPDAVDDAGDLASGNGRQLRQGDRRVLVPASQADVEQVDPGCFDGDPHLTGCGVQLGQVVEDEVGGGSELMKANGVHVSHSTSSSKLEVK